MLLGIDKGVIKKEEFHEITYNCGFLAAIDSEEFTGALQYFHDRGTILHFASSNSLKDIVILSPHWLTLFSYILIAHPYQRIGQYMGGREDNSFDLLMQKGILVGSFLCTMLGVFNDLEKYTSFELKQQQAVGLMKKFYFVAEVYNHKAKFLEGVKIGKENEVYIVPSLLPKGMKNQPDGITRVVYFHLPNCFLPPMLFSQMMAMCINSVGNNALLK